MKDDVGATVVVALLAGGRGAQTGRTQGGVPKKLRLLGALGRPYSNRTRANENKKATGRICASRGSAHVEEHYLPCFNGSCLGCGAPNRDVKVRDALAAKKSTSTRQSP